MKTFEGIIWIVTLFCLTSASSGKNIEVTETPETTEPQATAETPEYSTEVFILNITNSPLDNGMVIKDIGGETSVHQMNLSKNQEEKEKQDGWRPSTVPIVFPDNHKNFTPIHYYDGGEIPSQLLSEANSYRQQYKTYYDQKNFYSTKPIKFEENSVGNYFLPETFDGNNGDAKVEQSELALKPFPYAFEINNNNYDNNNNVKEQWNLEAGNGHLETYKDFQEFNQPEKPIAYFVFPPETPQQHEPNFPHRDCHHKGHIDIHHDNHIDHHHGVHHGGHHGGHHEVAKGSEYEIPWKKIGQLVTALVPLGLLLASLTPSVVSVDSTLDRPAIIKQRSAELEEWKFKEEDVLNLIKEYGIDSLSLSQCEDRVLCELARTGSDSSANSIEKGFWFLANKTPKDVAEKAGMNELFEAIKTGNCQSFMCRMKERARIRKRMMRNRKTN